jgi:hypothetical protein
MGKLPAMSLSKGLPMRTERRLLRIRSVISGENSTVFIPFFGPQISLICAIFCDFCMILGSFWRFLTRVFSPKIHVSPFLAQK